MSRAITGVNFSISSLCNLDCPDCCCDIPYRTSKSHVTWDYIVHAAQFLTGLYKINITGGEPLAHPQFEEWAPKFKALFGCEKLFTETNALLARKREQALEHFDFIHVSHYTPASYAQSSKEYRADNTTAVEWIRQRFPAKVVVGEMRHVPRETRRGTKPCPLATAPQVSYWDGLLYPCCVGPGVRTAKGIPLTENWREEIQSILPPCADCFYAEP